MARKNSRTVILEFDGNVEIHDTVYGIVMRPQTELPFGFRVILSAFMAFMFYSVVIAGQPLHVGRNGPIMPNWQGIGFTVVFATAFLKGLWTDADARSDLRELYF